MQMKTSRIALAALLALSLSTVAHMAAADRGNDDDRNDRGRRLRATLIGVNEVPSVSTVASGRFRATIARDEKSLHYTLSYSGLSSAVQQAHIHFAQRHTNGGVVLFLCQGAVMAPATVPTPPTCPQEGTVEGTLTSADVLPTATTQQIAAGEFAEVIAAIRAGAAYANVHSQVSGGGEIRGQITVDNDDHDDRR